MRSLVTFKEFNQLMTKLIIQFFIMKRLIWNMETIVRRPMTTTGNMVNHFIRNHFFHSHLIQTLEFNKALIKAYMIISLLITSQVGVKRR